jgi:hypothetical protein
LLVAAKTTTAEKAMLEQTPSGCLVDLTELAEPERRLTAESVRALCLEEAEGMDPRGVRIKGASIVGKLDFPSPPSCGEAFRHFAAPAAGS